VGLISKGMRDDMYINVFLFSGIGEMGRGRKRCGEKKEVEDRVLLGIREYKIKSCLGCCYAAAGEVFLQS